MNPETCTKCRSLDIITDHRSGDVICRGCGEVQAERLVDEGAEWNRYDDNDGKGDPSRVGGELGGTASRIWGGSSASMPGAGRGGGSGGGSSKKRKAQQGAAALTGADLANKKSRAQGKLEKVCMLLSDSCRSLHLDERVAQVGFTIADSASTEGVFKGKAESVLVAAVLYLACKHCGVLKSIAEVCSELGTNKFEVGRVINDISRKVKALEAVVFSPEEVVDKYGGQLRLPLGLRAAAVDVMKTAREVEGFQGMHPQTLAGAALLLLSNTKKMPQLVVADGVVKKEEGIKSGGQREALAGTVFPPPARSVGEVTGATLVGVGTMKKAHALLYEHRERVVPLVYAAEMASHLLELSPPTELDS
ncbi:hypothetical protein VYU27_000122 [Nannochloropsis oceanica]